MPGATTSQNKPVAENKHVGAVIVSVHVGDATPTRIPNTTKRLTGREHKVHVWQRCAQVRAAYQDPIEFRIMQENHFIFVKSNETLSKLNSAIF